MEGVKKNIGAVRLVELIGELQSCLEAMKRGDSTLLKCRKKLMAMQDGLALR